MIFLNSGKLNFKVYRTGSEDSFNCAVVRNDSTKAHAGISFHSFSREKVRTYSNSTVWRNGWYNLIKLRPLWCCLKTWRPSLCVILYTLLGLYRESTSEIRQFDSLHDHNSDTHFVHIHYLIYGILKTDMAECRQTDIVVENTD